MKNVRAGESQALDSLSARPTHNTPTQKLAPFII